MSPDQLALVCAPLIETLSAPGSAWLWSKAIESWISTGFFLLLFAILGAIIGWFVLGLWRAQK